LLDVERWAELRHEHFVGGVSIGELVRRSGLARNTVKRALRCDSPPRYERRPAPSKLDPFKDEIHALLKDDPKLPGVRVREEIEGTGFCGGKTIVDDYLREVRPLFLAARTYQRTVYRPGDLMQFDLWRPKQEIPVGYGQTRRGYVVVGALGYSRYGAGALVFSKEAPDVLWGVWRCLERTGALPARLVFDREGCLHSGSGRPTAELAAFCGQLATGWRILDPGDCQAKGLVERLQGFMETSFEPGRSFANELDFQAQLDRWLRMSRSSWNFGGDPDGLTLTR
jgi:transposase